MGSICILSISRIFNGSTCSEGDPHAVHLLDAPRRNLQIYPYDSTHISASVSTWHLGRPAIVALLCLKPYTWDPQLPHSFSRSYLRAQTWDVPVVPRRLTTSNITLYLILFHSNEHDLGVTKDGLLNAEEGDACVG